MFKGLFDAWHKYRDYVRPKPSKVEFEGSVFVFEGPFGTKHVPVADVVRIEAFKTDNITVDTIWIRLNLKDGVWEFSEDWLGYKEAVSAMTLLLPGVNREWFSQVYLPPFEECLTTIWTNPNR